MTLTFYPRLVNEDTTVSGQTFEKREPKSIDQGPNLIPANAKQM